MHKYILFFSLTLIFGQHDYSLEDLNPTSNYYQEYVGTSYFPNQVTLHYFGHYNWGTCSARFEQLNDLYEDLNSQGYDQVKLVGVGKLQHMSSLNNWTSGNDAAVCADISPYPVWSQWSANQRDLFVLDHGGDIVLYQNITEGLPSNLESLVIGLINEIPEDSECADGEVDNSNPCNPFECFEGEWIEIIIDCEEQMGFPCEGGTYLEPDEGECCSICVQYGDSNGDGTLNVLDVVLLINMVLNNEYNESVDMNNDSSLNVLDVVQLINLILS